MALSEAFVRYLRAGATREQAPELGYALRSAGYALEGSWLEHAGWVTGADGWSRVFVGGRPPVDAKPGDVWLDRVEVMPMVLVEEPTYRDDRPRRPVWLAMRPVARWQFSAFAAVAPIVERTVQVALGGKPLDPARLAGDEVGPITSITEGEASLYALWFGKVPASRDAWAGAVYTLGEERAASLWTSGLREWTGERCSFDEALRVRIGLGDIGRHPDDDYLAMRDEDAESQILVGEADHESTTGLRTVVGSGLLTSIDDSLRDFESITLASVYPR